MIKEMIIQLVIYDYPYFEKLKKISINLDKQREIRVDSKVIRHINLTGNLGQAGSSTMFL